MHTSKNKQDSRRKRAVRGVRALLEYLDPNPSREGLRETPERVVKAWEDDWAAGIFQVPPTIKVFRDGAEDYNAMIVEKCIPVYSFCEHHLALFHGEACVGYIPNDSIVGLSKIARVVDHFSRRLQVQERLTVQIADYLNDLLKPQGLGVILRCRHMCMETRGVRKPHVPTITSALRGQFLDITSVKQEFLELSR